MIIATTAKKNAHKQPAQATTRLRCNDDTDGQLMMLFCRHTSTGQSQNRKSPARQPAELVRAAPPAREGIQERFVA